jgi:hypothetical protein
MSAPVISGPKGGGGALVRTRSTRCRGIRRIEYKESA